MNLPAGRPWRPLAGLGVFVLLAHALLLQGMPAPVPAWQRAAPAPVQLRAVLPPALPTPAREEDARARGPGAVEEQETPARAAAQATRGEVHPPHMDARPAARHPTGTLAPAAGTAGPPGQVPDAAIVAGHDARMAAGQIPGTAADAPVRSEPVPAATAPPLPPPRLPAPAVWHYEVRGWHRGLPLAGRAELAWRHDGQRYEATLRIEAPPLLPRLQRSTGQLDAAGLQPLRFSERVRSEAAAHFDRDRGRILFSANRPEAPLQSGAQDRLSLLLQLAGLVATDPQRFGPGTVLMVQAAGTREAGTWSLASEGAEALQLPGGAVQALKFTRASRGEYDPRLELWFGPADYGLVRLRLTAPHGDGFDLQWSGTDKG